jgi:tetratricopeptide (TPR) repeat protein
MPDTNAAKLPPPDPEHRRIAASQFERANQVIATGNYDYGIRLLLSCCKIDPANLTYRVTLRRTEKTKYKNNLRGSWLAWMTTSTTRAKLKAAKQRRDYVKVLDLAELVLARNPWDTGAQMDQAEAADALGLRDLAIWTLEQARQKNPRDLPLNRALARLYEKRGNYTQAIALWEMIRRAAPTDAEASNKAKDLAAHETIARGQYQQAVHNQQSGARPIGPAAPRVGTTGSGGHPPVSPDASTATHPTVPAAGLTGSGGHAPAPTGIQPAPREAVAKESKESSPLAGRDPVVLAGDRSATEVARLRAKIEADPTSANAWLHLAGVYRRNGQLDEARDLLQEALGPTGNQFDIGLELADVEIEPLRRNLAIAEERLRTHPHDEEVRKVRVRLLKEINTRELDLFRRKADRFPTEMAHRFELGVRLLRANQVDEAIRELQAARSDPRQHGRALLYLGYCFKNRHNWRLAKRNFEEALQHLPPGDGASRKEILFQLAQGCAEEGDLAAAVDLANELANLDFAYRDIGTLLDEWERKLRQAKVATDK